MHQAALSDMESKSNNNDGDDIDKPKRFSTSAFQWCRRFRFRTRGINPASFMIADTGGFAEGDGVAEVGHVAGMKIWYGKHPPTKKRGHGSMEPDLSRLRPGSVITLDDWEMDDDEAGAGDGGLGS